MEKARDGSFVRTIRKTAEDDDEEDWDGTLNRYNCEPVENLAFDLICRGDFDLRLP